MSRHKRWSRLEQAEDIIDQCYELLQQIPVRDLRNSHMWIPSVEFLNEITATSDRLTRYMKAHKLNGWNHEEE